MGPVPPAPATIRKWAAIEEALGKWVDTRLDAAKGEILARFGEEVKKVDDYSELIRKGLDDMARSSEQDRKELTEALRRAKSEQEAQRAKDSQDVSARFARVEEQRGKDSQAVAERFSKSEGEMEKVLTAVATINSSVGEVEKLTKATTDTVASNKEDVDKALAELQAELSKRRKTE